MPQILNDKYRGLQPIPHDQYPDGFVYQEGLDLFSINDDYVLLYSPFDGDHKWSCRERVKNPDDPQAGVWHKTPEMALKAVEKDPAVLDSNRDPLYIMMEKWMYSDNWPAAVLEFCSEKTDAIPIGRYGNRYLIHDRITPYALGKYYLVELNEKGEIRLLEMVDYLYEFAHERDLWPLYFDNQPVLTGDKCVLLNGATTAFMVGGCSGEGYLQDIGGTKLIFHKDKVSLLHRHEILKQRQIRSHYSLPKLSPGTYVHTSQGFGYIISEPLSEESCVYKLCGSDGIFTERGDMLVPVPPRVVKAREDVWLVEGYELFEIHKYKNHYYWIVKDSKVRITSGWFHSPVMAGRDLWLHQIGVIPS